MKTIVTNPVYKRVHSIQRKKRLAPKRRRNINPNPFIIKGQHDYNVLDQAHTTEDYEDFVGLVEKQLEASLDLYLSAM